MSNLYKKFSVFVLIVLAAAQVSCGFHLRGVIALPEYITPVFIDLNGDDNELQRELGNLLSTSGDNALAASEAEAKTVLNIFSVQKKQRVVAVDNLGRARDYELNYQFHYELKKTSLSKGQTEIIKTNIVNLKRDLLFDPDSVLAVEHEKNAIYEDMRKDAAQLVLRQLSVIKPEAKQE